MSRRNKYGNVKVVVDGYKFDSKREAQRYQELKLMEKAGKIEGLRVHPGWTIGVKGLDVCKYVADFCYYANGGQFYVEDVKSQPTKTAVYRLKKKLMWAAYRIQIVEI